MSKGIFVATMVMIGIAAVLTLLVYFRSPAQLIPSLKSGGSLLLQMLPLLVVAFIVAGLISAALPTEAISGWVGDAAGWKGILIGFAAGGLMPGAPYAVFPVVGGLYRAGAGIGAMVAFLTSWATWQLPRIPVAVALLGPKLTVVWIASIIIFIPVVGFIASLIGKLSSSGGA